MRSITASAKYFLVQKLKISNKEATSAIVAQRFLINGKPAEVNQTFTKNDEVIFDNQILQQRKQHIYLAYNKPRGIETTLNSTIHNNLSQALDFPERLFPIGRLDKESEGLLLLTNDGDIFDKILHSKHKQEKEYTVIVNKSLTPEAIEKLSSGIEIMGRKTRPAIVTMINEFTFTIVLTQGLNRQIRRMCYKLNYEVQQLIRTRIVNVKLENLAVGEWRILSKDELLKLKQQIE